MQYRLVMYETSVAHNQDERHGNTDCNSRLAEKDSLIVDIMPFNNNSKKMSVPGLV